VGAFIVRPFGIKKDLNGKEIDFDRVERELIDPALTELGISGRTTTEILEAGNIRADMFQRLLTADLVVADLSIHNANVFYELGVRHALRDKRTFLLRCKGDDVPFDLQTDRYLVYDRDNPGAALATLVEGLRQTQESEEKDSPVFNLLPELVAQEAGHFLVVPPEFREAVGRAARDRWPGDLALLAEEARGLEWEREGLRVVGRAQSGLNAIQAARDSWEAVREGAREDVEANLELGTLYQRLGDLTRANEAIQRALDRPGLEPRHRSEAFALLGRNKKHEWKSEWWDVEPLEQRRDTALRSPLLVESFEAYEQGAGEDRNHLLSALCALTMCATYAQLAHLRPEVFAESFATTTEANRAMTDRDQQCARLATGVELALETGRKRGQREGSADVWLDISQADLLCVTSSRPAAVAAAYRKALTRAQGFHVETVATQLGLYERLGVFADNARAALKELGKPKPAAAPAATPARLLLFAGHRIDSKEGARPRFPAAKEDVARAAILEAVRNEQALAGGAVMGLAGGASGADILFHEACDSLAILTELYLALARADFIRESVAPAGAGWVERFERLSGRRPPRVLGGAQLPGWLRRKPGYGVWRRNNLWMLHNALARAGDRVTLIALWNEGPDEGAGGTQDMIEQARLRGVKTVILPAKSLFGL
jgi:hypothetical protein